MARRLPPLNSLRSFEAAGRLLSITRAAAELAVTQAAVSHQVKALEKHLGVQLFRRLPRQLILTLAGEKLLPVVSESLDRISGTVAAIREDEVVDNLSVRLAPSFAAKWLSPRLRRFRDAQPHIALALKHSNDPVDFRRSNIDLAITYGRGDWPDVVAEKILCLDFFPICAPEYVRDDYPLHDVENLRHYTLLHDATYDNWSAWLRLAGAVSVNPRHGTILDDTNVLMQAAIDGQGIALGSSIFVADQLANGRLVRPFDLVLESDYAYYIVCPEAHLARPAVRAFQEWVMREREPGVS
jgi:LysR family glycine cleavage system transcriptional activator